MEFNVRERLILLQVLVAVQGNLAELRILRELREELAFTEEDHKKYGIQPTGDGGLQWNDPISTKEIEIGDVARDIIVRRFRELNKQKVLTEDHLSICEKFPEIEDDDKAS